MSDEKTGYVTLYPPGGGEPVVARADKAERYLQNGWTKTPPKKARKGE